ncbi:MAG: 16S rRNA (uracil(1498)-N(3))-methyltransferase [Pseudomonadota bacterium]
MPSYQFNLPRLLLASELSASGRIDLDKAQANYLGNVMRARPGDQVLVFNGRHGEWLAELSADNPDARRPRLSLELVEQTRPQPAKDRPELNYLFAPIKQARQDYMVQKAVEMGVTQLCPVRTDHTQVSRVNDDRIQSNIREACEQCGVLNVPAAEPLVALLKRPEVVDAVSSGATALVFCDERAPVSDPYKALSSLDRERSVSVLIGPEGGFSAVERDLLLNLPNAVPIAIGPRILRADTAAVAALAAVQMVWGDWRC